MVVSVDGAWDMVLGTDTDRGGCKAHELSVKLPISQNHDCHEVLHTFLPHLSQLHRFPAVQARFPPGNICRTDVGVRGLGIIFVALT